MTHYTDEDLILYFYGEGRARGRAEIEHHLESCGECAGTYRALAGTLQLIAGPEVPERDEAYPLEVWQRIRSRLPEQDAPWWHGWFEWRLVATATVVAALVVAAFIAGRVSPLPAPAPTAVASVDPNEAGARVRLAATGDHLEQSERVLLDLVNADGPTVDLTDEQAGAADLINSNRLFREAATRAGDTLVANLLDELERSLLEIVHGPSTAMPAELEEVRTRVDAAALLFKVRILADELHEREVAPVQPRKTT
jgi:anti-sigma factor RsiW